MKYTNYKLYPKSHIYNRLLLTLIWVYKILQIIFNYEYFYSYLA